MVTEESRPAAGMCPVQHDVPRLPTRMAARLRPAPGVPRYTADIYTEAAITEPYPHYAAMRALGPVVWLEKQRVYALPRHAEVKRVLADDTGFLSGTGVGLNAVINKASQGTTLNSDGQTHRDRRQLVAHRLTPRALRTMSDQVEALADATIAEAVERGCIDAVADIALKLPLTVVPDFVGWPDDGREHLLRWGGATFDLLGPGNSRALRSIPSMLEVQRFLHKLVRDGNVLPGSMSDEVLQAARSGTIDIGECPKLMFDYMAPSIDTTASAIAAAVWLFATHPEQWQLLKDNQDLVSTAVQEVVRLESPLRAFTRVAAADTDIAGVRIPSGARVLVMYASANRDERVFADPDRFDITRDSSAHVGFGYGAHGCAGQGLARLETQAILRSLLRHVDRIEVAGEAERALNNIIRRYERLPVRLVADR